MDSPERGSAHVIPCPTKKPKSLVSYSRIIWALKDAHQEGNDLVDVKDLVQRTGMTEVYLYVALSRMVSKWVVRENYKNLDFMCSNGNTKRIAWVVCPGEMPWLLSKEEIGRVEKIRESIGLDTMTAEPKEERPLTRRPIKEKPQLKGTPPIQVSIFDQFFGSKLPENPIKGVGVYPLDRTLLRRRSEGYTFEDENAPVRRAIAPEKVKPQPTFTHELSVYVKEDLSLILTKGDARIEVTPDEMTRAVANWNAYKQRKETK